MERHPTEKKILKILATPMNTLEVAAALKIDRHTAVKYLEGMESKGLIRKEIKRRAKLWHISKLPAADVLNRKDAVSKQLVEILDSVDQHISIQDRSFQIIWKNTYAKQMSDSPKCHEAYFNKAHRCKNCPVEATFKTGKAQVRKEIIPGGTRKITTKPLKDENNNTTAVVEIIRDIKSQ